MTGRVEFDKATALVREAGSILIVTHYNPDGDAIGSMLGLAHALRAQGKSVDVAVDDGVPAYLQFMTGTDSVYPRLTVGQWDVMISSDASDEPRSGHVGEYGRANSKAVINLDHHITNTLFGDVFLVMPEAVSATEVVFHWLNHMGTPPTDLLVAEPLLTGLITDTMGFRTSHVTPGTLGVAQALLKSGASMPKIVQRTLESKPFTDVMLWSQALKSIHLEDGVASVNITQADVAAVNAGDASDNGLVNLLNQINEANVAVIFIERPENQVKLSMRSKRGYDVGTLAGELGGGGHPQAAGVTLEGTLPDVRERVLPRLRQVAQAPQAVEEQPRA